jgi:hypothetical protein
LVSGAHGGRPFPVSSPVSPSTTPSARSSRRCPLSLLFSSLRFRPHPPVTHSHNRNEERGHTSSPAIVISGDSHSGEGCIRTHEDLHLYSETQRSSTVSNTSSSSSFLNDEKARVGV